MMNRRRFLAISAAALATPAQARPIHWQGYALGAEVRLTLEGDPDLAQNAIVHVRSILERCETLFSLYRPDSTLAQLNRTGFLSDPDPDFHALLVVSDTAYKLTGGFFDPTVQPLWTARTSQEIKVAQRLVGWDRVRITRYRIQLDQGQSLTLNGIAQGYATDLVARALRQAGWTKVLVNVGEFHAGGRTWTLGVSDPMHGLVETIQLQDRAVATSSPTVSQSRSGGPHILDPNGARAPQWSTVSVQSSNATIADALSTAFCYANKAEIRTVLSRTDDETTALCVNRNGTVNTLTG